MNGDGFVEMIKTITDILGDIDKMENELKELPDNMDGDLKKVRMQAMIDYAKSTIG